MSALSILPCDRDNFLYDVFDRVHFPIIAKEDKLCVQLRWPSNKKCQTPFIIKFHDGGKFYRARGNEISASV